MSGDLRRFDFTEKGREIIEHEIQEHIISAVLFFIKKQGADVNQLDLYRYLLQSGGNANFVAERVICELAGLIADDYWE